MTRGTHLAALGLLVAGGALLGSACYSTGDGSGPRLDNFYFPVGLAVPPMGNVLYVVNSDFDLQYNGGTVQAYDLPQIRIDAQENINTLGKSQRLGDSGIYARGYLEPRGCGGDLPVYVDDGSKQRQPLGQTCAPQTHSEKYVRHDANGNSRNVVIGAFATDLQISKSGERLYIPVRGDASLTYINIDATGADPFNLDCGVTGPDRRCLAMAPNVRSPYQVGNDPNYPVTNTRHITMPGEPFGMALSDDGSSVVITHQNDTKTSLFSTGCTPVLDATGRPTRDALGNVTCQGAIQTPTLEFVLDGVPAGGNGVTQVPHDLDAYPLATQDTAPPPRDAYLQTSRAVAEIDLLRYYSDQSPGVVPTGEIDLGTGLPIISSLHRPFIQREAAFSITANASGIDSRGVVVDDTPRRACKAKLSKSATDEDRASCARIPARVFIANRAPASILLGEIGEPSTSSDQTYDPDRLVLFGNQPLTVGPSNLYLAPIIDTKGNYALRLFIICFDSATIFVWDPDAGQMENIIRVGQGPFAMAFDPFDIEDVAKRNPVAEDPSLLTLDPATGQPTVKSTKYRFAYIASFTQSYVQVLDLSQKHPETYERVVYTLGQPTLPKGTN